jgi:hypothetical protein
LPDFSWSKHSILGKIYQMTTNNTKRPWIIPNRRKIFEMVLCKMYQLFPFQGRPKFTQIAIFGKKINHLATLVWRVNVIYGPIQFLKSNAMSIAFGDFRKFSTKNGQCFGNHCT